MSKTDLNGRIVHKHDSEENWNKVTNFIPFKGEILIYDTDSNYIYERVKVGNGVNIPQNLPFALDNKLNQKT